MVENSYNVVNERTEIIFPDQFFLIWRHIRFVLIISIVWLPISVHLLIQEIFNHLKNYKNLMWHWVISIFLDGINLNQIVNLKKDLNEPLENLCAIDENGYRERFIKTDNQKKIVFPSNFKGIRFRKKYDISSHILASKFKYNFSVAMYYLKNNYNFSLLDFKLYRLNLITNDGYINHYQKVHRDFKIKFNKNNCYIEIIIN